MFLLVTLESQPGVRSQVIRLTPCRHCAVHNLPLSHLYTFQLQLPHLSPHTPRHTRPHRYHLILTSDTHRDHRIPLDTMARKHKNGNSRADRPSDSASGNASSGGEPGDSIPGHFEIRVEPVLGDKRRRRPQWMNRLRSNSATVVEPDPSDSDASFNHAAPSKHPDDDTLDEEDDDIEIVIGNDEYPPPALQRKANSERARKVTFDSRPASTSSKTNASPKGILKKSESGVSGVVLPITPTLILNQGVAQSSSAATENSPDHISMRPSRLQLPRRPSRSNTVDSVLTTVQVAEVALSQKPRDVVMESSSDSDSGHRGPTTTLAKEIVKELVKEVKLLQPENSRSVSGSPPQLSLNTPTESSTTQPSPQSSPSFSQTARPNSRLSVRRRQQAWRQRRGLRKSRETEEYVDTVLGQVGEALSDKPKSVSPIMISTEPPSFYWDPTGAFNYYSSAEWWENLRKRANVTSDGSRSYRKQLFLTVDGIAMWICNVVSRVRKKCLSVRLRFSGVRSRLTSGWWSSTEGSVIGSV